MEANNEDRAVYEVNHSESVSHENEEGRREARLQINKKRNHDS